MEDQENKPHLHMHIACGRDKGVKAGCVRKGVKIWHILEVIMTELVDTDAKRLPDPIIGFSLLNP